MSQSRKAPMQDSKRTGALGRRSTRRSGTGTLVLLAIALLGVLFSMTAAPLSPHGTVARTSASSRALPLASGGIVYSKNTTLSGDLFATDVTINPGVTVTMNGFLIVVTGTLDNMGTVAAGYAPFGNYNHSYGGSGGGSFSYQYSSYTQDGLRTRVPGGEENTSNVPLSQMAWAGNGSTPRAPSAFNRSILVSWIYHGFAGRLAGAGGGNVSGYETAGLGSSGIYIQARTLIAGNVTAVGQGGSGTCSGIGLSGAGGGGVIILAYGTGGLTPGHYNVSGGKGAPSCGGNEFSGYGGAGHVLSVSYGTRRPL